MFTVLLSSVILMVGSMCYSLLSHDRHVHCVALACDTSCEFTVSQSAVTMAMCSGKLAPCILSMVFTLQRCQVTVDVAWSPRCIDLRCYDIPGLAMHTDFLFVMAYDEQSRIYGDRCVALANSDFNKTLTGDVHLMLKMLAYSYF